MAPGIYEPIVQELVNQIGLESGWRVQFEQAVHDAVAQAPDDMQGIETLGDFYNFLNSFLTWVPFEGSGGREIYKKLCLFYFIFGRKSVYPLQTEIKPSTAGQPLTWLSDWLVRYAQEIGKFMDTPESLTEESLETFRKEPAYHMEDYLEPHGGWKTFNQFFARNVKPGYRPIANMANSEVIVSPADSTFEDQWPVDSDSIINIKGLPWSISELLKDSKYANDFKGGSFMHSFLSPTDYHRMHAPVGGKVLETKLIPGQVYLDVTSDDEGKLQPIRHIDPAPGKDLRDLDAQDATGYQFCQARGLVVLDTEIGLVAVLPIGMAQVSSVILTAEEGKTLFKGEEIAYFQFGGSDIVIVFQAGSKVNITTERGTHNNVGVQIGTAKVPSK
ncbi:putative phosphatidylserine decarboxylase [Xylaria longipes]|nr:putative phosphatidylserine decarboxylase [Xylaria longipes]RYC56551.1 hypothetical protein CHU98_g9654 [Xylaria longipes]